MARPTKYKPEYCERVIEFMADGSSKVQFCAEIDIHYETFLNWQDEHPEFSESVKKATAKCQAWWEAKGKKAVFGEIEGFNPTGYIFNMKNRFGDHYSDRKEIDHQSSDGSMTPRTTLDDFYAAKPESES